MGAGTAKPTEFATRLPSPLTARQREVLRFILASQRERGVSPALREICACIGASSTNSASDHLRALERKGYITRHDAMARGIVALRGESGEPLVAPTPAPAGTTTSRRVVVRLHEAAGVTLTAFRVREGWHCAPPCSDTQPVYATPRDAALAHATRVLNLKPWDATEMKDDSR